MKSKSFYISILFIFLYLGTSRILAQENEELKIETENVAVKKKRKKRKKKEKKIKPYEPLAPARAAFYSAILPGLGQIYNGKGLYWRLPAVYGALGAGIYSYTWNNQQYNRLRDAYKRRLAGFTDDEFFGEIIDGQRIGGITDEGLIDRQRRFRRDQELSLLITVGIYILNIIEANVTAHLNQYNISDDLSFKPKINYDQLSASPSYGLSINYSF